jgi:class 3 adenylate cyclase
LIGDIDFFGDPVNTASKLGEDLAVKAETLVTKRAIEKSALKIPEIAERMVARISGIEIKYVRLPMTEIERTALE